MNKYRKSKIYKIVDVGYNKCYIGSTTETLSRRMARHRSNYNKHTEANDKKYERSMMLFDEFGVENCKIELIENYPCNSKDELFKREGHYIQQLDCVNRIQVGRTRKDYYNDNQEDILEKKKQYRQDNLARLKEKDRKYHEEHKEERNEYRKKYYEENKDELLDKMKAYTENNKEALKEKWKKYYEENKEVIRERSKGKTQCDCGGQYTRDNRAQHYRTQKHQNYLNLLEEEK